MASAVASLMRWHPQADSLCPCSGGVVGVRRSIAGQLEAAAASSRRAHRTHPRPSLEIKPSASHTSCCSLLCSNMAMQLSAARPASLQPSLGRRAGSARAGRQQRQQIVAAVHGEQGGAGRAGRRDMWRCSGGGGGQRQRAAACGAPAGTCCSSVQIHACIYHHLCCALVG